jgi:hypothetical protein
MKGLRVLRTDVSLCAKKKKKAAQPEAEQQEQRPNRDE